MTTSKVLLACAALLAAGCTVQPPPSAPNTYLEKAAPALSGRTLSGARIDAHQLAGRVIVVKFFAKWCEPCTRTLPEVERLHREHPKVKVIGISLDERRADVDELVQTFGLSFPVIQDRSHAITGKFRVRELPKTFVIDRRGTVRWVGTDAHGAGALPRAVAWVEQLNR